jgi:hypothetical protein
MGQALAGPSGKGPGILDRNPGHGLIFPARRIAPIFPVTQEIVVVLWTIVGCTQEFLELGVCHRRAVDKEATDVYSMPVGSPGGVFPRILHIHTGIVAALDFNAAHLKVVVSLRNADHARRSRLGGLCARYFDHCLRHSLPLARVTGQGMQGALGHVREKFSERTRRRSFFRRKNRAETATIEVKA